MLKLPQLGALIICSIIALLCIALYPSISVNNKFVLYILLFCIDAAILIFILMRRQKLLRNLLITVIAMSAFAFFISTII